MNVVGIVCCILSQRCVNVQLHSCMSDQDHANWSMTSAVSLRAPLHAQLSCHHTLHILKYDNCTVSVVQQLPPYNQCMTSIRQQLLKLYAGRACLQDVTSAPCIVVDGTNVLCWPTMPFMLVCQPGSRRPGSVYQAQLLCSCKQSVMSASGRTSPPCRGLSTARYVSHYGRCTMEAIAWQSVSASGVVLANHWRSVQSWPACTGSCSLVCTLVSCAL